MDRLREIEFFLAVAEAGSFAAAARTLRASPSAVSRAVASLEARLGARLILRTTRQLRLTEAGLRFHGRATEAVAALEAAGRDAAGEAAIPSGRLAIGAPVSFGRQALAPVLGTFLDAHPRVRGSLILADRVVNLVEEGIDVALRIGELSDSRLIARRVGQVRRPLVAAPAYLGRCGSPGSPPDLRHHAFIAFTGLMRTESLTLAGQTVAVRPRAEVNDAMAALALAEAGHGITILPSYLAREALAAGRLIEVLPDAALPARPAQLVFPELRLMAPAVRAFVDHAVPRLSAALA